MQGTQAKRCDCQRGLCNMVVLSAAWLAVTRRAWLPPTRFTLLSHRIGSDFRVHTRVPYKCETPHEKKPPDVVKGAFGSDYFGRKRHPKLVPSRDSFMGLRFEVEG